MTVNGTAYQPSVASNNKKAAKTMCATVALQAMGMIPRAGLQQPSAQAPPTMSQPPQEPLPPHLEQQQQMNPAPHTLRTVPDIDLSAFR